MSKKPTTRSDRFAMKKYLKDLLKKQHQRIAELEEQLKEKDNEHTKEMRAFEKKCQAYYNSKEFAIKQLEKVKEEFNSRKLEYKSCTTANHCYGLRIDRINELIDIQIEELKDEF